MNTYIIKYDAHIDALLCLNYSCDTDYLCKLILYTINRI